MSVALIATFLVSFLMLAVAFLVWALVGLEVTALRLPTFNCLGKEVSWFLPC